ncbi:MAG: tetratricopeptide repeat protein [Sideroxydans sp.]|jgi:tetratricopeptide (TPR) repeat protein
MSSILKRVFLALLLPVGLHAGIVLAQPLDEVRVEYQSTGIIATIHMTAPVRYLRHFPSSGGTTLEIYYERVPGVAVAEAWVDNEVRQSPPSGLFPAFTVTTRDQQTQPRLVIQFAREAQYSVAPGPDQRSFLLTIKPDRVATAPVTLPLLPTIKPLPATPPANANLAENNRQGFELMTQAREALAAKNNDAAIGIMNKLLLLPPNDYTESAQEWVGVARERAGQFDKAKTEYDLYLNMYPQSEGVPRVVQRLADLGGKKSGPGIVEVTDKKQGARWSTFGAFTSRYYFGKSNIDSTTTFNNATDSQSISLTDQSMLVTTEDASARYVTEEYDGRIVFRGANTKNFIADQSGQNRISALYGELKGRTINYQARLGRQSATGGGVGGRFDGVSGGYGDAQDLRVNGVAGSLVDYSSGTKPTFYGASVDSARILRDFNLGEYSLYGINQSVDGTTDRQAVGAEWRYYQDKKTLNALIDVDTYFNALNVAQLMGTWGLSDTTVNFMLDRRKTPSLSIRNALNGASVSSVSDLLQTMSASSLRRLAIARTTTTSMGQVGVTRPFMEKWQVGGDVRMSYTRRMGASGTINSPQGFVAAIPSRGHEKIVSAQIIGSGLYKTGDIWSFSGSIGNSGTVNSTSIFLYNHTGFDSGWGMDSSLQLYRQTDQFNAVTTRISPMVRGEYRISDQLMFDVDGGIESSKNDGTQVSTTTLRVFGSAGLRWYF